MPHPGCNTFDNTNIKLSLRKAAEDDNTDNELTPLNSFVLRPKAINAKYTPKGSSLRHQNITNSKKVSSKDVLACSPPKSPFCPDDLVNKKSPRVQQHNEDLVHDQQVISLKLSEL